MLPIGPLMIEHRLIERMIAVIDQRLAVMEREQELDVAFLDATIDFVRTYTDHCHHGKEEHILFRELAKKPLTEDQQKVLQELLDEHRWGRETVAKLVAAKEQYLRGDDGQLTVIVELLRQLVDFYPGHIEKEDQHFFLPIMKHFTDEEKQALLQEGYEFDRNLIHEKYRTVVEGAEAGR